ncbi:MAG: acyltransferase [Pseudomonadota bacterium]
MLPNSPPQQFSGVQILRFVAAMLVAVMHVTQAISIHITGQGNGHYWALGSSGVDIFFVISGFVMATSTPAPHADAATRRSHAWTFVKRRLLRIVPLYWFYTLLKVALLVAMPALAVTSTIDARHLLASLFFIPAMSPWGFMQPTLPVGWTLNYEMLFYAVFTAAIALGAPRIRFCLAMFGLVFLASALLPGSAALGFYAETIVLEFLLGVFIAYLRKNYASPPLSAAALLLALGLTVMFAIPWAANADRFLTWGLGAGLVVLGAVWLEPWTARQPGVRPLAFLGDASYSIYLSHTFIVPAAVMVLHKLGLNIGWLVALLVCSAVIVGGALSYLWLERPMTAGLKRWLFPKVAKPVFPRPESTHAK